MKKTNSGFVSILGDNSFAGFKVLTTSLLAAALILGGFLSFENVAQAATTPTLGTAGSYGILSSTFTRSGGLTAVTGNAGYTTLNGPGTHTVTGVNFMPPPAQAGLDQGTALSALASQACTYTFDAGAIDLAASIQHPSTTYTPGVYCISGAASIGTAGITLSGTGTYIFRVDGALTSDTGSVVTLDGASASDVFWTPTEATTLAANTTFAGIVIDAAGITVGSTATWTGRALAFGGTVTTDTDSIGAPAISGPVFIDTNTNSTLDEGELFFNTIQAAVNDPTSGNTGNTIIVTEGTYGLSAQLNISKPISIIGNGAVTLKAISDFGSTNGTKHLLTVYAGASSTPVIISNVTLDCDGKCYGFNTYSNAYGILNDVTVVNSKGAGLTINGSTVVATNLNTSGNAWGAVNVDPGDLVTTPSVFTLNSGTLAESNQIWSDGTHISETATVTVNATGYSGYAISGTGHPFLRWADKPLTNVASITASSTTSYYNTIQDAIGAASTSTPDTINVAAGTYSVTSPIVVDRAVTITGPGSGVAKVQGTNSSAVSIFEIAASNATIQNLEITHNALRTKDASPAPWTELANSLIRIPSGTGLSGIVITNNKIYVPAQSGAMSTWNGVAITVGSGTTTGISITGNIIHNTRNGVVVQYNNTATVSNNSIYDTKGGVMNYTNTQADANNRTMSGNSWSTTHNEWDIVWNSGGGPYEPDYHTSVLDLSGANNNAYVLSLMTTGPIGNLTGNRSHIFVNVGTGTLTKHQSNGNHNVPYATIALGLEAVVPGGTVNVAAGTYNERLTISKSITLTGNPGNASAGPGSSAPVLNGTGLSESGITLAAGVTNVVIEGFEIRNFTDISNGGMGAITSWDTGASNITIQDNNLHDTGWNGVLVGSDDDTVQTGWIVRRNIISNTPYAGIELTNVTDSQVTDNQVAVWNGAQVDLGDSGVGIEIAVRDHAFLSGVTAGTGNVVSGNTISGGAADGRAGINLLARAYQAGSDAQLTGVTVENNTITGVVSRGLLVAAESRNGGAATASTLTIQNNTIMNGGVGISVGVPSGTNGTYASLAISSSTISGNTTGLQNTVAGLTVNAANNWWGTTDQSTILGLVSAGVDFEPWYINPGRTILSDAVTGDTIDATTGNLDFAETSDGGVSLPGGASAITMGDDSVLNFASSTNDASGGNITVGSGPVLLDGGIVSGVNLNLAQNIGGQSVMVEKGVKLSSGSSTVPILLTNSARSNASVSIPDGTTILAPSGWTGTIQPPKTGSGLGTAPSGFSVGSTVISVGSPDTVLLFDKAVKLTLTGVTGSVGYKPAGSDTWTQITTACNNATDHSNVSFPNECYFTSGSDTIIWTYHFTTFGSLVVPPAAPPAPSGGGGGGGSSGIPWDWNPGRPTTTGGAAPAATGEVLGATTFNFSSDLKLGMSGDAVTELQKRLVAEGVYSGPITGYFGPLTLAGTKAYQAKKGVSATGYIGPLTRAQLNGSQVAGASTSTVDTAALQAQISALQAQLVVLLQQLAQALQSQL